MIKRHEFNKKQKQKPNKGFYKNFSKINQY